MANLTFTYRSLTTVYSRNKDKLTKDSDFRTENNQKLLFTGNSDSGYARSYSTVPYNISSYGSSLFADRFDFGNGCSNGYSFSDLYNLLNTEGIDSKITSIKLKLKIKPNRSGRNLKFYFGECVGGTTTINGEECTLTDNRGVVEITTLHADALDEYVIDITNYGLSKTGAYAIGGSANSPVVTEACLLHDAVIEIEISDIEKRLNNDDVVTLTFSPKSIEKFVTSNTGNSILLNLTDSKNTYASQGFIPSSHGIFLGSNGDNIYASKIDFNGSLCEYNDKQYSLLSLLRKRSCIKSIKLKCDITRYNKYDLGLNFGNVVYESKYCQIDPIHIRASLRSLNNDVVPETSNDAVFYIDLTNFDFLTNLTFGIGGECYKTGARTAVTRFEPTIIVELNKVDLTAYMYNTKTQSQVTTAGTISCGDESGYELHLSGVPGDVFSLITELNEDTVQFYHQFERWFFVGPGSVDDGASLYSPNTRIVLGEYDSILRANVVKDSKSYTYTPILNETDAGTISGENTVKYGTPCQIVLNKTGNKYNFIQWSVVKKSGDDPGNPETTISDDQITFDFECKGDYDVYAILEIAFENNAIVYTIANGDNSIRKVKSYLYFKKGDTFNNVKIFYFGNGKHVYEIEDFSV